MGRGAGRGLRRGDPPGTQDTNSYLCRREKRETDYENSRTGLNERGNVNRAEKREELHQMRHIGFMANNQPPYSSESTSQCLFRSIHRYFLM
jgi:hypothetical protein